MRRWPWSGEPTQIGSGAFGTVYRLDDTHAVKCFDHFQEDGLLTQEHDVCKHLFDAGIRVPKPYGIFAIDLIPPVEDTPQLRIHATVPGFVMQYIPGMDLETMSRRVIREKTLDHSVYAHSAKLAEKELEKCRDLGMRIPGDAFCNFIYTPENDSITLVDFHRWRLPRDA